MSTKQIADHFSEATEILQKFNNPSNHLLIQTAGKLMVTSIQGGGKIISCGNGGSMCDAMHFTEELMGKWRKERNPIPAICINDPSYFTCVSNDFSFDDIFSRAIEGLGKKGDIFLGITTSGNSKNIIEDLPCFRTK